MSKQIRKELFSALVIFLAGGIIQTSVFCPDCWSDFPLFLDHFLFAGCIWAALWKGTEYTVCLQNRYVVSWLEAPVKRLMISLLAMVVYTPIAFVGIYLLFSYFIWDRTWERTISGFGFEDVIGPILITFFINTFMHGRSFLLDWRQAAINLERLKTEQISTRFESLKNQVNPHFMFNSLNALSSLVYEDQDRAVKFIRKLSDVFRYVLDQKDKEVVPLSEELDFLRSYVYLQQIRFENELKVNIDLPQKKDLMIPPLSLQMLVENAIKHNVIASDSVLSIDIHLEGDKQIVVKNNIKRKRDTPSTGIGLENLRLRYEYLSDKKIDVRDDGSVFEVKIPILTFS